VPKPPEVDKFLENMADELEAALAASSQLVTDKDIGTGKWDESWVKAEWTPAQVHTALGYQKKGMDFVTNQRALGRELTPLIRAPHVLHRKPMTLPAGTRFELVTDAGTKDKGYHVSGSEDLVFEGFGRAPNGDITLGFLHEGTPLEVRAKDPAAVKVEEAGQQRKADPSNPQHVAAQVPGEMLSYLVEPGDELRKGQPLCVVESMKMEVKISVPDAFDRTFVKSLPCKVRNETTQGDLVMPGDLLLEVEIEKVWK